MKYFKLYEDYSLKKLSDSDRQTLLKLDEEYGRYFRHFWNTWNRYDCKNTVSEFEKFMAARKEGRDYYPQLKLVEDSIGESFLVWSNSLKEKFEDFDCYLSPMYIENIEYLIAFSIVTIRKGNKAALALHNRVLCPPVSAENYNAAWEMLKENPYKDIRESQPYRGADIMKSMQDYIDKRGYGYKVILDPYMVARKTLFHIRQNCI